MFGAKKAKGEKFVSQHVAFAMPSCKTCQWRSKDDPTKCLAYPVRIPIPILTGEVDHKTPYEGDQGLIYKEGTPSL